MKDMKRVLQIFGTMNCGGAETMLMNIYRNIDRTKIQFDFLVHCDDINNPPKGYYDDEIKELGGKIFYIGSQGSLGILKYICELKKFLKKNKYDTVHSHMDWLGGTVVFADFLSGVKRRIVHSHTAKMSMSGLVGKVFLILQKTLVRLFATDRWACSVDAAQFLYGNSKSEVITNAIALEKFILPNEDKIQEEKKKYKLSDDTILIGHVGTFSSVKNQLFLLDVAKLLSEKSADFKLILTGKNDTDYAQKVFDQIAEYGLGDKVICPGLRSDIYNFMNMIDVFCFPSAYEGLGMVAVEAQAAGVPCIASENVPKAIDVGVSPVVFLKTDSAEIWAEKILEFADKKSTDKEMIKKKITEAGYDIAENAKRVEQFYLQEV